MLASPAEMRRQAIPYAFLAPYLAVFAVFWAWPIVQSILFTFQNTRVNPWRFQLGVNWGRLLGDSAFWGAVAQQAAPSSSPDWKRHGLTRVFCSDSRIDSTMGHAQKTANTAR